MGSNAHEVQQKVEQAITILRLFKAGSARYLSYTTDSESLTDMFARGSISSSGTPYVSHQLCIINNDDVPRLEYFWRRLTELLPPDGYRSNTQVEPLGIAYQRYSDALLMSGTTVERKIADAVMGLESLVLKGSEKQESTYRLRTRVAKLLSLLGRDPYSARIVAGDAYTVRSAFVHGDNVQSKERRKIETRHESFAVLLNAVLDQLRMATIVLMVVEQSKDDFISLLDDSFIDHEKSLYMEQLLTPVRMLI